MIALGYTDAEKLETIAAYQTAHGLQRTVVIAGQAPLPVEGWHVTYEETILYRVFYPLLQFIDGNTLVVVNELLRSQDRNNLYYNCVRHYLNQTPHVLVFQHLPFIDTVDDFMTLFDFATQSRWKRHKFDLDLVLDNTTVDVRPTTLQFDAVPVAVSAKTRARYVAEKTKLFANLGHKDPHTLPRNLYLIGGADKLARDDTPLLDGTGRYVARNARLRCDRLDTYEQATADGAPYTILEFPHRFLDFSDFLYRTRQTQLRVLVADLPVDAWYWQRYSAWKERLDDAQASLQQR